MKMTDSEINREMLFVQSCVGTRWLGWKTTCVTKVARAYLLYGAFFYDGVMIKPRAKSLGAGVYEVWGEENVKNSLIPTP